MSRQTEDFVFRLERKQDDKIVEQTTFRALIPAPPTGSGDDELEASLIHKMHTNVTFLPKLDFVTEMSVQIVGNIMYSKSRVVKKRREVPTLTFGPVSV